VDKKQPVETHAASTPQQLLDREDLSREQKIERLRQWEFDLLERMVADDENMSSAEPAPFDLDEVLAALRSLGEAPAPHPVG
jgi:Arc/MetJ-type ribon-helix-helix transcriptional regulator